MPRLPSQLPGTLVGWDRPNSGAPRGAENLPPRRPSFNPSQARPSHHHQHVPSLAEERSGLVPLSIHSHHPSRTQSHHSHHPSAHASRHPQAEHLVPLSIHSHHPSRTQSHHSHHPSVHASRYSQAETLVPLSIHPSQAHPPAYQRTHTGAPSLAEVRSRLHPKDSPEQEQLQPLSIHSARQASVHPSHHPQAQAFDEVAIAPRARDSQMLSRSHHHSRSHHSQMPPRASQMQVQPQGGRMSGREASVSDDGSPSPAAEGGDGGYSRQGGQGGYEQEGYEEEGYEEEGYGLNGGGPGAIRGAIGIGGGKRLMFEVRRKGSRTSRFERR